MQAVAVTGPGRLEVGQRPEPHDDPGRALVAIERVGLCGTDVGILSGKIPVSYPRILGHEVVGRVVRSDGSAEYADGQRVLVDPSLSCGRCRECRADRANLCRAGGLMGRDVDGGFTELVSVDENRLLPVPDDCSDAAASCLQVLGTCVHAQSRVPCSPGQTAVVVGLGVSGFLMLQLLVARGLRVVGITRTPWKRELGLHFGAVEVAVPQAAEDVVADVTGGTGAELVVEAVGTPSTVAQSIRHAAPGGMVMLFGTTSGAAAEELPMYDLYYKELTLWNPRAALYRDYAAGIDLAARGLVDLDPLCTHSFPLTAAEDAFAALTTDSNALKVAMYP